MRAGTHDEPLQTRTARSDPLRYRVADFVADYWVDGLEFIVVGCFYLASLLLNDDVVQMWSDNTRPWKVTGLGLSIIGVPAYLTVKAYSIRRTKRISALQRENAALRRENEAERQKLDMLSEAVLTLTNERLRQWGQQLDFGSCNGSHERITVYSYHADGYFTAFGRHSSNPAFEKPSRRSQYQEEAGCIGRAWQDGYHYSNDYPDPRNLQEWVRRCQRDGIPEAVARSIRMKSRLYFGYRIEARYGDRLAVVVVESTDTERFTKDQLLTFFQEHVHELRDILEAFAPSLPRLPMAREAGF